MVVLSKTLYKILLNRSTAILPGLSPLRKKADEASSRRAVAETPTLAGHARLGLFPARPLQGQFHLARSFCSCSAARSRSTGCSRGCPRPGPCSHPTPSPEAACRFRRYWLIIPLALAHNFSSCGSKSPFLWLKTPFPVAHNSPSCGSKSPLLGLNSIGPQASLPIRLSYIRQLKPQKVHFILENIGPDQHSSFHPLGEEPQCHITQCLLG